MPSIFKLAAVAAFAAVASAQFSNSTGPVAAAVPGRTYLGCYAQQSAGAGVLVETSAFMTNERCALDCSSYTYSLIQGNNCYCSQTLNGTAPVAEALCNTRCPGNAGEACGGAAAGSKRQAAGNVLTVYQTQAVVAPGVIYQTIINNFFIDYCPVCVGGTTTRGYYTIATVTGCGCPTPVVPAIAYVTTVTTCPVQGSTTVLTLTVPSGVVPGTATVATITAPAVTVVACATCPGGSTTVTTSACPGCAATTVPAVPAGGAAATTTAKTPAYTGAASAQKVGSGLLVGAAAVAALL